MSASAGEYGFLAQGDCHLTRRVFRDDALQAAFDERGYVTTRLVSPSEVEQLRTIYLEAAAEEEGLNPPGAYNDTYAEFSVIHSRVDLRERFFTEIAAVLGPRVAAVLEGYRPLVANFVNKPPGTGVVPAHQNWSVVDESRFQSVSVWVALVDCVMDNGAMYLYDGSHRGLRGRRGMWAYAAFSEIEEELVDELLTPVFVQAGDAIILDDSVVHYSPPNESSEARLAIQYVMIPDEAEALFHQQVGADADTLDVAVWRVDEGFFFDFWHGDGDPEHGEVVDRLAVPNSPLDLPTVKELVDRLPSADSDRPAAGPLARLARRLRRSDRPTTPPG